MSNNNSQIITKPDIQKLVEDGDRVAVGLVSCKKNLKH